MNEHETTSAGDLEGRVALVTGASAGLGFAAAAALAARGARLMISSRGGDKLDAARDRLSATGGEVVAAAARVERLDELEQLVGECRERLGPVDVLVANGGGPTAKPALELTEEDFERAIPLAFLFVPRLCRLVVGSMRQRGWGRIVAINSISSRQPIPSLALSNALRPAVLGYLKTLSQEVAGEGVTVNAVLPGYTRTERQEELIADRMARTGTSRDEVVAAWASQIPMRRQAEAEEIGAVIGFLCSPAASYVTGQAITADGGYVKSLL